MKVRAKRCGLLVYKQSMKVLDMTVYLLTHIYVVTAAVGK